MDAAREQHFAEFLATHRDRAVGLAWRLVGGDPAAAEDVAQEAFARAYRGLHRFREDARLSTWFYRILVNEARRYLRWRWAHEYRTGEMPAEVADFDAPVHGDPAVRERVQRAMARLSRGQREAFVLVYLEGMSIAEAAAASGRAQGTIKVQLHRALRALRAELADLAPEREDERR